MALEALEGSKCREFKAVPIDEVLSALEMEMGKNEAGPRGKKEGRSWEARVPAKTISHKVTTSDFFFL